MPRQHSTRPPRGRLGNIEALCFDFDGVIRDTEAPWYGACRAVYEHYGYDLPLRLWAQLMTSPDLDAPARALAHALGASVSPELQRAIWRQAIAAAESEIATTPTLPGVVTTMAAARRAGAGIAIVTNADTAWLQRWLPDDVRDLVDVLVTKDVSHPKPSGAGYRLALRALKVSPDAAIGIEDSPAGAMAVIEAGMTCFVVPSTMTRDLDFPPEAQRVRSVDAVARLLNDRSSPRQIPHDRLGPVATPVAAPHEALFA